MSGTQHTETVALIALLQMHDSRWAKVREELEEQPASKLLRGRIAPTLLDEEFGAVLSNASEQLHSWEEQRMRVVTPYSSDYPSQLRAVHDFPPLLFARGHFDDEDANSVAIVGTRTPSTGALRFIDELVPLLAADRISIVSGLAKGVDGAAMTRSLEAGNRTVGIIGTGLNVSYPRENATLQSWVADEHLLISQFWPDAPPSKQSFPMRNHVMSAYSGMTLIVEASENSGTRIQARAATKHGRPLILSKAVYLQTKWAKDLVAQRFDVRVVSSAREALEAVKDIRRRRLSRATWVEAGLSLSEKSA